MNHTPAPWLAIPTTVHGRNPDTKRMDIVSNSGEWHPAFVAGDILPSDAHLIASAPDLLRALEWIVDDWEKVTCRTLPDDHEVKAAIAKAKGLAIQS